MAFSPLVKQLIESLQILPGIGPKSAQRMAFYILERDREGGTRLAHRLAQAVKQVGHCQHCRILCENALCFICEDKNRNRALLCIVEGPQHVLSIENTGGYMGYYFVLSGHLSPIDGIGPQEIGIPGLVQRLSQDVKEIILATNSTVEGEATAYYIADLAKAKGVLATRIANGVPLGGELDYVDAQTIAKAMVDRYHMNQ